MKTFFKLISIINLCLFFQGVSAVTQQEITQIYRDLCMQVFSIHQKAVVPVGHKIDFNDQRSINDLVGFFHQRLKDNYTSPTEESFRQIIRFLLSLCPGENRLDEEDHQTFFSCIKLLTPVFYPEPPAQEKHIPIELELLEAAFQLSLFEKYCQEQAQADCGVTSSPGIEKLLGEKRRKSIACAVFRLIDRIKGLVKQSPSGKLPAYFEPLGVTLRRGILYIFKPQFALTNPFDMLQHTLRELETPIESLPEIMEIVKTVCTLI